MGISFRDYHLDSHGCRGSIFSVFMDNLNDDVRKVCDIVHEINAEIRASLNLTSAENAAARWYKSSKKQQIFFKTYCFVCRCDKRRLFNFNKEKTTTIRCRLLWIIRLDKRDSLLFQ